MVKLSLMDRQLPPWQKKMAIAAELLRNDRGKLWHILTGDVQIMKVYALDTRTARPPLVVPGMQFRYLDDVELRDIETGDEEFRQKQIERLARFGRSYAYGVYCEGVLAHISWLLPPCAVHIEEPRILQLNPDEAEITACETLPAFRGRGIYGFAIRQLLEVARTQRVSRVYMKTMSSNVSSQSGIAKAGLKNAGRALIVTPPLNLARQFVLRLYS